MNDATEVVTFERLPNHVALVRLNRPDKRNAINAEITLALAEIVRVTEADPDIWVTVLASTDARVFCSGSDLSVPSSSALTENGFAGFVFARRDKPWIAAIEGLALAGGCEIALACEMRVCGESSCLGLPEVKRGIVAAAGGPLRLARCAPLAIAIEMVATGDRMSARRAHELGLVNRVVRDGDVLAEAMRLANAITVNAPIAVREAIRVVRSAIDLPEDEFQDAQRETARKMRATRDRDEGIRAFLEKRMPVWRNE